MKKVLIAGATGYLGQYLVKELKKRNYWVRVLIRKESQKQLFEDLEVDEYFIGQITQTATLKGVAKGIDWVFTTVGITRQKEGLTYMDVDYQGNMNLLQEAKKEAVSAFLYVSALNGENYRHLKIFEAKERFVDALKTSGLNYTVVRPNGFFSDMRDFLDMAKGGTVYLFGDGNFQLNPIAGADLAKVCVDKMEVGEQEVNVGGPDTFTQNQLAKLALIAWSKNVKIMHLPDWVRKAVIWTLRTFTSSKVYGPFEFFLTAMAADNIAPAYGKLKLEDFFHKEVQKQR